MSGRRSRSVEGTETGIFGMSPASGRIARKLGWRAAPISIAWSANCLHYMLTLMICVRVRWL